MLATQRLILRRWEDSDAESLYEYARDPDVGPIAGWPAHQSIEESRAVIRNVFNGKEAYAICLKTDNRAIGAIELKLNGHTDLTDRDDECELGYWLGKPFWGHGIMPEAVKELLRQRHTACPTATGLSSRNAHTLCASHASAVHPRFPTSIDSGIRIFPAHALT